MENDCLIDRLKFKSWYGIKLPLFSSFFLIYCILLSLIIGEGLIKWNQENQGGTLLNIFKNRERIF